MIAAVDLPFADAFVRTHHGVLDVDRMVAHAANEQRLFERTDDVDGIVIC